jgi:hypothetical protein
LINELSNPFNQSLLENDEKKKSFNHIWHLFKGKISGIFCSSQPIRICLSLESQHPALEGYPALHQQSTIETNHELTSFWGSSLIFCNQILTYYF